MTGHEYEYIVAAYLRRNGYTGVSVTQGSGDYGVDVVAKKHGARYAVQCKYYSKPVGQEAVREAVAGKAMYRCQYAMVVTNSTFTKAAEDLARINGVVLLPGVENEHHISTMRWLLRTAGSLVWLLFTVLIIMGIGDNVQNGQYILAARNTVEGAVFLLAPWWIRLIFRSLKKRLSNRA